MAWEMEQDRPIYVQLIEKIQMRIISGFYPPGSKLPSVRELAAEAGVNPNTMQKAFSELERSGLLTTMRTSGRVVTEDEEKIRTVREVLAERQAEQYFAMMKEIGFTRKEAIEIVLHMDKEDET
jgi:DNA-binding transcriptional regulator YhcF (GntR family)